MPKHSKKRARQIVCRTCGDPFITGSSIAKFCSVSCRVKDKARCFDDPEVCWIWPGSTNQQTGYGQVAAIHDGVRTVLSAHRASFAAFIGSIPDGMQVLHKCDVRACFNPRHLFLGSQLTNMRDMIAKGRQVVKRPDIHWTSLHPDRIRRGANHHLRRVGSACLPRGVGHPASKLTDAQVLDILESTETLAILSGRHGVSKTTVSRIRRRQAWKHVSHNLLAISSADSL